MLCVAGGAGELHLRGGGGGDGGALPLHLRGGRGPRPLRHHHSRPSGIQIFFPSGRSPNSLPSLFGTVTKLFAYCAAVLSCWPI